MRMRQTNHEQVTIEWHDLRADVDEEIAPLILALWQLGIRDTSR
jgi:hypothetical protein